MGRESELVQEEQLPSDTDLMQQHAADGENADQDEGQPGDADLVEEWSKSLEDPILDQGQSLHVVV